MGDSNSANVDVFDDDNGRVFTFISINTFVFWREFFTLKFLGKRIDPNFPL